MTDDTESTTDAGATRPRRHVAPVTALFGQRRSEMSTEPVPQRDDGDGRDDTDKGHGTEDDHTTEVDHVDVSQEEIPALAEVTALSAWSDARRPALDDDDEPEAERELRPVVALTGVNPEHAPEEHPPTAHAFIEHDAEHAVDPDDDELSPHETEQDAHISREEAIAEAEQRLLRRLRRGDRSREELRRQLATEDDVDESAIEELLERLEELGYIDDLRMAEVLADTLFDRRGKGMEAVRRELRQRLLSDDAIERALDGRERDDEHARAASIAATRAERLHGLDRDTALRRLVGFLQRRGFGSGVAFIAANEALDGAAVPPQGSSRRPGKSSKPDTSGVYFGNTEE